MNTYASYFNSKLLCLQYNTVYINLKNIELIAYVLQLTYRGPGPQQAASASADPLVCWYEMCVHQDSGWNKNIYQAKLYSLRSWNKIFK